MPAAICLLLGMASVLLATGCGASGVDVTDASVRISTGSTSGAGQSQLYRVPSGSMEPTLPIGTRVLVKKEPLTVGSIVVYHQPEGALEQECGPKPHVLTPGGAACDAPVPQETKLELIKRIVAGPGDEIFVREGHIYRKAKVWASTSARVIPTSARAEASQSAISRSRSRFQPGTGS